MNGNERVLFKLLYICTFKHDLYKPSINNLEENSEIPLILNYSIQCFAENINFLQKVERYKI